MVSLNFGNALGATIQTVEIDADAVTPAKIAGETNQIFRTPILHDPTVIQGTWAWADRPADLRTGRAVNNFGSNAINDQLDYYVTIPSGTYTFFLLADTAASHGIITLLIDDVSKGTMDTYAGDPGTDEVEHTITSINVATGGTKKISLKVTGKTGSQYYLIMNDWWMLRTGAAS